MTTQDPSGSTSSMRRVVDDTGAVLDQRAPVAPDPATVGAIMTRTVYCVKPDVGIGLLASLFLKYAVSGLPVVDERGRAVGVVTKTDLLAHLHGHATERAIAEGEEHALLAALGGGFHAVEIETTSVRDIMMPIVFAVAEDVSIAKAAALMAAERVHRLPILDRSGAVCGILSALDVVGWVASEAGYPVGYPRMPHGDGMKPG